jgi:hypothetical protein
MCAVFGVLLSLVFVALACAAPGAVAASAIVGEVALTPNAVNLDSTGQDIPVFQGDTSGNYVLTVPHDGTITSWSFLSGGVSTGSTFVLRLLRSTDGNGESWEALDTSAVATVTSATGTDAVDGPFVTSVPVSAGERIALEPVNGSSTPVETGISGVDGVRYFSAPFGDGSSSSLPAGATMDNGQVVPIQATETFTPANTSLSAPADTTAPAITGVPAVGNSLSCGTGAWTNTPTGYSYQWARGQAVITGATGQTYVTTSADSGQSLTCRVTAVNSAGAGQASSAGFTIAVALTNTSAPTVAGVVKYGNQLTCDPGNWTGSPKLAYNWAWRRTMSLLPFSLRANQPLFGVKRSIVDASDYFTHRTRFAGSDLVTVAASRKLRVPDLPADNVHFECAVTATLASQVVDGQNVPAQTVSAESRLMAFHNSPPVLVLREHAVTGSIREFAGPRITPGVGVGATNTCTSGTWTHSPHFAYAWYALGPGVNGVKGTAVRSRLLNNGQTLTLAPYEEHLDIECVVTAINSAGRATAATNHYIVPADPPKSLQPPYVDVHTEEPTTAPGIVGPEGAQVIAEQIDLTCDPGKWNRGDLTYKTEWVPGPRQGQTGLVQGVGSSLSIDMAPGKLQFTASVECAVTATTSHGAAATSYSGVISVWNGCVEILGTTEGIESNGNYIYFLEAAALPVSPALLVAGFGVAVLQGLHDWFPFIPTLVPGFSFGQSPVWYTYGPNCGDYQQYLMNKGYTVRQG